MTKKSLPLESLNREQLLILVRHQAEQIAALKAQNAALEERLSKLEQRLNQNSTNSSKPPSSDGFKKPKPKSRREKGTRPSGGQIGHKGETLELSETPDAVIVHPLSACPCCQHDLSQTEVERVVKRQVFDLPPLQLEVTEHQAEVKRCPGCGKSQRATFPGGVNAPTQYGARVLAQAAYLNSYHLIPLARVREWFADCVGHALSEGVIERAVGHMGQAVAPSLDAIYARLTRAAVVHYDETGFRIASGLGWLHTACTEQLSYYCVHRQRGDEAMLDIGVLPNSGGWAVHDGLKGYFGFETVRHALCNAHHLRELQGAFEQYGARWAQAMQTLLVEMKRQRQQPTLVAAQIADLEARYTLLLDEGFAAFPVQLPPYGSKKAVAQHPVTNLLIRLRDYRTATLAFLHHPEVPFDNNLAERDLRMMKVKQKISGAFRTWAGAEIFAAVRSYLLTARKQGLSMLHAAVLAFDATPFIPAIPE